MRIGWGNRREWADKNQDVLINTLYEENSENVRNILTSSKTEEEQRVKLDAYQEKHKQRIAFVLQGWYVDWRKTPT